MLNISGITGIPASLTKAWECVHRAIELSPVKDWLDCESEKDSYIVAKHSAKYPGAYDIYYYTHKPKCADRIAIYAKVSELRRSK